MALPRPGHPPSAERIYPSEEWFQDRNGQVSHCPLGKQGVDFTDETYFSRICMHIKGRSLKKRMSFSSANSAVHACPKIWMLCKRAAGKHVCIAVCSVHNEWIIWL